jgi:hypothetical protein
MPQAVNAWISDPKRSATLVVIEFGASWPRWLEPSSGDMAVVAQHYESEPSSLITQVASRVTRVEAMGWRLDSIVFVANNRTDPTATAARSVLARGLLARLEQGELVLTVGYRAGARIGQALMRLAAALESGRPRAAVGVRIGEARPVYAGAHLARTA